MGFRRGSWREERDAFFLYFSMPTGGRQGNVEAKSGHPFFLKKSIRRGEEGEKSLRESPHTTGLQHPHHPCLTSSLTSRIEREKKAAAAGPRFLLFFPSARRAVPHRAWDDLLAWRPPPLSGGNQEGSWGKTSGFSACRAATSPETAGSPPARPWTGRRDTHSPAGLPSGVSRRRYAATSSFLSWVAAGASPIALPSGSPVGRSGVHVPPVDVPLGNRQSWWWLDCARSLR